MVEAMARGLPCIGSDVGGIPELLDAADIVPAGDRSALAAKLSEVLANPARLKEMAERNFETALHYREELLHERRVSFYQYLRRTTEAWFASRGPLVA
jgi:glycosyltransferase involved in cell wall biosynthesis